MKDNTRYLAGGNAGPKQSNEPTGRWSHISKSTSQKILKE